ncbi:MAG: AraC family transcriptional regulator [Planctomycetota bacterium]|nr:AraC family transcriptional regulator [Planctomycetota bacterium]
MTQDWQGKPRGILRHDWNEQQVVLGRFEPSEWAEPFVEYFWSAQWDLRGHPPRIEESLPHPCVHLVLERGDSNVFGVMRKRFVRELSGLGQVFGIKFRPGGFTPLVTWPVSNITDVQLPVAKVFGAEADRLERQVLDAPDSNEQVGFAEAFLRARLTTPDDDLIEIRAWVDAIAEDHMILKVADLADVFQTNVRRIQRQFQRHVGVGPKWVIQRYRLHEALERVAQGKVLNWAIFALNLGYTDQAHFIRDFKLSVGTTPEAFARTYRTDE